MRSLRILLTVCCLAPSGCAVKNLCKDQDQIRCCLLDLYTNQVMDNLIRASNGLPIIQLDYTNASSTITVKDSANINDRLDTTRSTVINQALATTVMLTRTTLNSLTTGLTHEQTNQVAVTAVPVTTANEVYDAYLQFLTLPGSLQVSCNAPEPGSAQIWRKHRDQYYWVPITYRKEFFALSLATTAQRGKSILPVDDFYLVTIKEILEPTPVPKEEKVANILIKFDKKIPNDVGRIEFNYKDKNYVFFLSEFNPGDILRPNQTDRLYVLFDPKTSPKDIRSPADLASILPLSAKVRLTSNRPIQGPNTNELLDRIQFQLQQIQFNQMRIGAP